MPAKHLYIHDAEISSKARRVLLEIRFQTPRSVPGNSLIRTLQMTSSFANRFPRHLAPSKVSIGDLFRPVPGSMRVGNVDLCIRASAKI